MWCFAWNNSYRICDYHIVFWKGQNEDGSDVVVYLPEKVLHSTSAANYPYQRTKVVDFSSDFQTAPTAEELRAKGEKYIENNDIGTPTVSLDVSFIALHQTQEYADMTRIYHINLCDTVTVLFPLLNVSTKAKVVKTVYNVLLDRYDSITIGAVQSYLSATLEQISEELQARGFTTLRGKEKLTATTISRNLRNEIYKGDRQIQKAPHIDMLTHKPEKGGEYKSYYVEQDHEGIVSEELWDEVQKALAEQRNVFANKNSHYLRGKVVCANCGEYFMRATRKKKTGKYKKWICKGHLASSGCKNQLMWEEDLLAHIEKKLGASDKETCEQIEKILVYPDGRVEIETK